MVGEKMLTAEDLDRYQRQILLLGEEKQGQLASKKVLQVGAGGLGSPLALYLVASGIGELILFENDILELSNLGRQVLYNTEEIGQPKAELAKAKLEALNPNVKVTIVNEWLSEENAARFLQGVDYLVDASDNFETKFLINDLGIKFNIPFTIAGIEGFEGQLISVDPGKTACYRCIFGKSPKTDKSRPIPVISATCGVIGSLEAMEIVKGLLNYGVRALNHLLMVDLKNMDFQKIPVKINSRCICQRR